MQLLAKKKAGLGIFILTIIVAIALLIFLVWPKFADWRAKNALAKSTRNSLVTLNAQRDEVKESIRKMNSPETDLARLNAALPTTPDVSSLYAHLEILAKSSNLLITAVQATDENDIESPGFGNVAVPGTAIQERPVGSEDLGIINVNLEVQGSLQNFNQFLGAINRSLRIIDVQSVDASAVKDKGISFKMGLRTYYQK